MLESRLGALLRRSKTLTLISQFRHCPRVSNESSLLSSSKFAASRPFRESVLARYSSLYGFRYLSKLNHRILATVTLISVGGLWLAARKIDMHPAVQSLIGSTMGMAALQVMLGISTLLSYVPVSLASAHQAGALTLLTLMILLTHTLRKPSPALLKSLALLPKSNC